MKFSKMAVASAALLAVMGAQAQVTGGLGGNNDASTFLSLSGPAVTLSGSFELLTATTKTDVKPVGAVGSYLSVEMNQAATLTFAEPTSYLSFLWGSPDSYNRLVITDTNGVSYSFTAASLGLATGSNKPSEYVHFTDVGASIATLTYSNAPKTNAFETANYSVTPVPEPETYALMLGGLGLVGFMARRRRG